MTEYKLKSPIILGEETVEVLLLEEPTVAKLQRFNVSLSEEVLTSVVGMTRLLLSCCSNCGEAHIKKMKLSDLTGAIAACTSFFE
jgi:hypothetical protein